MKQGNGSFDTASGGSLGYTVKPSLNNNNKQHKHLHTVVMLPHQQVRARLPSQAHYAHHREKEDTCTHIDLHPHRIPRLLHEEITATLRHSEDYIKNRQEGKK